MSDKIENINFNKHKVIVFDNNGKEIFSTIIEYNALSSKDGYHCFYGITDIVKMDLNPLLITPIDKTIIQIL